jgi:NADPH-dependent ferric siderophore reductase
MTSLVTEAEITLPDAAGLAAKFVEHLAEHDVACETSAGRTVADLGIGAGVLEASGPLLKVRLEADDLGKLEMLRSFVASHVVEFADGPEPSIVWRGGVGRSDAFSDFREVTLKGVRTIAPRMRRLTFAGDVARFASEKDLHVRMYFPPEGLAEPEWPRPGPDGRTIWPADDRKPEVRYYTVRRVDVAAGEIDLDFVLHADAGPGADFALRAAAGSVCGIAGPLGRTAPTAAWTLLAGDETALPAIARILEAMPVDARGAALIEVEDESDEIPLDAPAGLEIRWLRRGGETAGAPLVAAIAAQPWPDEPDMFAWVACEYGASKTIRKHLRSVRGLPRERHLVVGYWEREAR